MTVLYNENDPHAAQWLRNLIEAGLISAGDVDDRSIVDVRPEDLAGYTRVHFFAGIGLWDHALNLAGWPSERAVWTGSCPCQPFSVAGNGLGADDPRHLWPHFHRLIAACRPPIVLGEQVAGKAGEAWFDGVAADLEGAAYACEAFDIPALAVNAPHIRQRLYWCAVGDPDAKRAGRHGPAVFGAEAASARERGEIGRVRDSAHLSGTTGGAMADADEQGRQGRPIHAECSDECLAWPDGLDGGGFWDDYEWRVGADGKARRVGSDLRLLVDGDSFRVDAGGPYAGKSRVSILKGYGNAIVPPLAAEFVRAVLESEAAPRMKERLD